MKNTNNMGMFTAEQIIEQQGVSVDELLNKQLIETPNIQLIPEPDRITMYYLDLTEPHIKTIDNVMEIVQAYKAMNHNKCTHVLLDMDIFAGTQTNKI